ncbi:ribonuclease R family protein, partial [Mesorhizobium sp. M7A.F.Ca.CA.001.06.1.1]
MARKITGRTHGDPRTADTRAKVKDDYRPSRDEILRYIAENPDRAGKRDIAKAFALRGDDRIWLKDILRDLQDEGVLTKERKGLARVGALPHVTVLDIFDRDADGVLLARPTEHTANGPPPIVSIRLSRSGSGPAPGIGDRVLAKTFPADDTNVAPGGPAYTGRVVKIFEKRTDAVLGIFRILQDGTFRIEPVERRQPELIVDKEFQNGAKNGDLVEVEPARASRFGLPRAKVLNVLGSLTSEKAVSMIAIHAHDIPHIFPADVIAESEAVKPATLDHREDWRDLPLVTIDPADAKDHDDAVFATPDLDEKNPGGVVATVAIADVAAYVRYGTALDREALKRGNSVYFPDRVVPMLPERISNDLCSLREGQDRPALAVRMIFSAEGRKLRHTFHRVMMKSAAKLAYQQAQAAIDGAPDDKTG